MNTIICIFYNENTECTVSNTDIISAKINHSKCAILTLTKHLGGQYTNCRIIIDQTVVLNGDITDIKNNNKTYIYTVKAIKTDTDSKNDSTEFMAKFRAENPNIFQLQIPKSDKPTIKHIENWITKNSLITKIDQNLPIYEIDLCIKASWLRCVYGAIDLTNKIKYVLSGKLLSTLTPNKLKHSWFKTFTPLCSSNLSHQTKYFIAHSKLIEENTTQVNFGDKFNLKKTNFQYELSIGWEYEQLECEEIHCHIINQSVSKVPAKVINIDLHNVQEYMPDIYQQSFYKTEIGKKINNTILQEVIKYMENSLYNIHVRFQLDIIYSDKISLYQPVELNGVILYVQELEYVYEHAGSNINVTCVGTQYKPIDNRNIELQLPDSAENCIMSGDIIERIVIQNTADIQFNKLNKFVTEHNCKNNEDMKTEIKNFLNQNQTKVIIKTKPLKTSYINNNIYTAIPINLS